MIRLPLPGADNVLLLSPRWSTLEPGWQFGLVGLALLVPAALVVCLYRHELRLVSRRAAALLLGLRLSVIAVLWALVVWQPIIVYAYAEELPSRVLIAVDRSGSMNVRDPQRTVVEKLRLARALNLTEPAGAAGVASWLALFEQQRADDLDGEQRRQLEQVLRRIDDLTRGETARRILGADGLNLVSALAKRHNVSVVGFHEEAWDVNSSRVEELFMGEARQAAGQGTDLTRPLLKALEPAAGSGPLLGVILLTDGQHNVGLPPVAKAAQLAAGGIPIYPVALGARQPPADVAVVEVKAPPNAFKDVDLPIEARVKVSGLPAQEIRVELHRSGKPEEVRTLKHDGTDRTYTIAFQTRLEETGTQRLEVKARPADSQTREVTTDNNARSATVRVSQDTIRVLLVDGEARWEHQYLANALARDKAVTIERVLFVQARVGEIPEDKLEKLGHPALHLPEIKDKDDDPLNKYDCIVLGDAPPDKLDVAERRRLERYVAERGGTLVIVAGKRFMPLEYIRDDADDSLAKLLPVKDPRVLTREDGFAVTLTQGGVLTPFLRLDATPHASADRWGELPKQRWAVVGRAQPGAEALAFVADDKLGADDEKVALQRRQTLFAQQPYGFGRVLFIGLDSTWRWRYRVGDLYHHRFWGQMIRWAASDSLLPAGNRFIRYGSRVPVYRHGQPVEIALRLLEGTALLKPDAVVGARLVREGKAEASAVVPLRPSPNQARLWQGQAVDLPAGTYRIHLDIPDLQAKLAAPPDAKDAKNPRRDTVVVLPPENGEMLDLSTNWMLLQNLAAQSRGAVYTPENVHELIERFARQVVQREKREAQRLWQDAPFVWWLLVGFLILLTLEWLIRKGAGLA